MGEGTDPRPYCCTAACHRKAAIRCSPALRAGGRVQADPRSANVTSHSFSSLSSSRPALIKPNRPCDSSAMPACGGFRHSSRRCQTGFFRVSSGYTSRIPWRASARGRDESLDHASGRCSACGGSVPWGGKAGRTISPACSGPFRGPGDPVAAQAAPEGTQLASSVHHLNRENAPFNYPRRTRKNPKL